MELLWQEGAGRASGLKAESESLNNFLEFLVTETMVRETVERILPEIPFDRIMIVTTEDYSNEIKKEIPEISETMVVAEPRGRNTAPCIALAAYKIFKQDPEGVMVILPADHLIANEQAFLQALRKAHQVASGKDYLITFGIVPAYPETGYGYIEMGQEISVTGSDGLFQVKSFVEKPDLMTAKRYVDGGNHLWNSGMFVWKASTIIRSFQQHLPSVSRAMESIMPMLNTAHEPQAVRQVYETMENISIDYGILEKADNAMVIRADIAWNDVGSWSSLSGVWETDNENNACRGKVLCVQSKECVALSPQKVAVLLGVEDLVIVDTPDAILVCHKDSCQDIKKLQELLVRHGYEDLL